MTESRRADVSLSTADPTQLDVDAVLVGVGTGDDGVTLGPGAGAVDAALGGVLVDLVGRLGGGGGVGDVTKLASLGATTAPVVATVGLGKDEPDAGVVRRAAGAAVRAFAGTDRVGLALPLGGGVELVRAAAEGALLGSYDFVVFKSSLGDSYKAPVAEVTLLVDEVTDELSGELDRARAVVGAVRLARDWINTPPNVLRPPEFADAARAAAVEAGLEVEVLDAAALRDGGYGGILAVGDGSSAEPRLVRIAYTPAGDPVRSVALVGKGITFDTGGISIKPNQHMAEMKSDMSGAACVVGAMLAIAALKPSVKVTAYVPMAENMPSGAAYRPGDVVTMYGGRRVEVLNTDAEGRMILADAIARASEDEPDYLIEASTLTGGAVVSLGNRTTGLMGSAELLDRVKAAGETTGEPMWPMPLPDEVKSGMDSAVADITQIDAGYGRAGHMLQGGIFLREFVGDDIQFAHLDIAGPAFNGGSAHGFTPKGGTGAPLRTLVAVIEDIAENG